MCKKVYERKYVRYNIKFEYINGNFSIAAIDETKYDKTSYKSMLDFYKYIKENYKLKNVDKIKFQGIDKNGSIDVFFEKSIFVKQNKYTCMDNLSILEEMSNLTSILKTRKVTDISDFQSVADKKQDVLLHQIENFNLAKFNKDVEMEEKIKLFDELQKIRKQRRELKNDICILSDIKNKIDLNELYNTLNNIINSNLNKNKKIKFLSNELVEELNILKEVKYTNDKQRIGYMKQMQNKYSKIVNDEIHKKLICYNKAN